MLHMSECCYSADIVVLPLLYRHCHVVDIGVSITSLAVAVLHGPCRRGAIVVVHYNCHVPDDTLSRFSGIIVVRVFIIPLLFYAAAGLVDIALLGEVGVLEGGRRALKEEDTGDV